MAGMRDYTDDELELVRKSFGGRYMLRDRCYFEMALQMGLRVSEMLSITVARLWPFFSKPDSGAKPFIPGKRQTWSMDIRCSGSH